MDGPHVITVSPELLDVHGQQLGEALEIEFDILREPIVRFPLGTGQEALSYKLTKRPASAYTASTPIPCVAASFQLPWLTGTATWGTKNSPPALGAEAGLHQDFPGAGAEHELKLLNCGEFVKVKINLGDYFPQGLGHVVLQVQPWRDGDEPESDWTDMIWIQRTSLGLSMFGSYTHHQQTALVHDLRTGQLLTDCHSVVEKGTWRATRGLDSALLPVNHYQLRRDVRMFAFTDRHLYRPGEEVFVKGWFRERSWSVDRPLEESSSLRVLEQRVAVSLYDCNYEKTELETLQLSDEGSFSFSHRLGTATRLGECRFSFSLGQNAETSLSFMVEEFRRPLFEVTVEDPDLSAGACRIAARELRFTAKAKYLAGGALSSGRVSWIIEAAPVHYVPPGHRNSHLW